MQNAPGTRTPEGTRARATLPHHRSYFAAIGIQLRQIDAKTARRTSGRAASWRLVMQPFACRKNRRRDSRAQERRHLPWAMDDVRRSPAGHTLDDRRPEIGQRNLVANYG
jgi:hypothetical protein